jgi:isoquinoline 1-oxidoreductase subunit beta
MVLADELQVNWARVCLQLAIGSDKYGSQDTDGSCSIHDFYETMREAGAHCWVKSQPRTAVSSKEF